MARLGLRGISDQDVVAVVATTPVMRVRGGVIVDASEDLVSVALRDGRWTQLRTTGAPWKSPRNKRAHNGIEACADYGDVEPAAAFVSCLASEAYRLYIEHCRRGFGYLQQEDDPHWGWGRAWFGHNGRTTRVIGDVFSWDWIGGWD